MTERRVIKLTVPITVNNKEVEELHVPLRLTLGVMADMPDAVVDAIETASTTRAEVEDARKASLRADKTLTDEQLEELHPMPNAPPITIRDWPGVVAAVTGITVDEARTIDFMDIEQFAPVLADFFAGSPPTGGSALGT